ncbi:hypothetical protein EWM64_g5667 [Hericium alpestre]|uniref:SAP domain-containing protein n=1 Tax=Hericium alpestre TaxID=135208 RepID=A0A4Y9ZWQ5_9AGAM|nr:hypothetical protein EWM64_g5667 [Hericium alpestre]
MLRFSLQLRSFRHLSTASVVRNNRNLVSSVLLTRTWENKTVADLKEEAKKRGIPARGNKATLITRIQEHDQRLAAESVASPEPPAHTRNASTAAAPSTSSPPPPPPSVYPKNFLEVKIPDLSASPPEPPIAIPLVPDLWESSRIKAETEAQPAEEPTAPKIVVVAGSSTHAAGGPTYNLEPAFDVTFESPPTSATTTRVPPLDEQGVWADIAEDLCLPTKLPELKAELKSDHRDYSRKLSPDEARGLSYVLGAVASFWVGGWMLERMTHGKPAVKLTKSGAEAGAGSKT